MVHGEASMIFREAEVDYHLPNQGQLGITKGWFIPLQLSAFSDGGSIFTVF